MHQNYLEKLKRLTIMDDDFGRLVFKDLNCSIEILKILHIMNEKMKILHHETQSDIKNLNQRSVIFDVLILTNQSSIDIELENKKSRSSPLRARLHASEMDVHLSKTDQDFKDLLENIVIFICSFDPYGYGLPIYTIKRKITEINENYKDKASIIYINGDYQGNDEIGRFIHDLRCQDPKDMYNEVLKERVKYFKESKGGYLEMCQVWEEIREEGKIEGKIEGILEGERIGIEKGETKMFFRTLYALMNSQSITLETAMEMLSISKSEYEIYESLLAKQ